MGKGDVGDGPILGFVGPYPVGRSSTARLESKAWRPGLCQLDADIGWITGCRQNYLAAMLKNPLLSQTTSDFNVIVRDDGSKDGTLGILESYKPKFDGRLRVIGGEPSGFRDQ